jgi:hypothetical protein
LFNAVLQGALQAVTAIADFLSFLFGRVDAASAGVRSGDRTLDEAVTDVLAVALQRADSLKQSFAGLPDAKMAQAAQQEVDAAVIALKQRLQVSPPSASDISRASHPVRCFVRVVLYVE